LQASDIYDDSIQLLLSKAAAVYFKHTAPVGEEPATADFVTPRYTPYSKCGKCIGWIAQQHHRCVSALQQPVSDKFQNAQLTAGTRKHCGRCLGDGVSDDEATALLRARVHYYMASMLLDSCLTRPERWLATVEAAYWGHANAASTVVAHASTSISGAATSAVAQGVDVSQEHMLFTAEDLGNLHHWFDEEINKLIRYSRASFDYDSPIASVALGLCCAHGLAGCACCSARFEWQTPQAPF
jgi:hypothetical protein